MNEHMDDVVPTASGEHTVALRLYFLVFAALLVLLALTVAVAYLDLGIWSVVIAVTIATIKALLVILYFMHARYSSRLILLFATLGFATLGVMFLLTFGDYLTRTMLPLLTP